MTDYAIVYPQGQQWLTHAVSADRDAILREYADLHRVYPAVEVRVVPTGLVLPVTPLVRLQESA